ncbi:MAG: hypothetical protein ACI8XC_000173 [Gammaproteobacteria bacterium]|jgi:hypothetical protein
MQRSWLIIKFCLTLILILILLGILINKLHTMTQVRGLIEGATEELQKITAKSTLEGRFGEAYWIAWNHSDIKEPSSNRINIDEKLWIDFNIGDTIPIIRLSDDPIPYYREGIYASDGNFILDFVLIFLLNWWLKRSVSSFLREYDELED